MATLMTLRSSDAGRPYRPSAFVAPFPVALLRSRQSTTSTTLKPSFAIRPISHRLSRLSHTTPTSLIPTPPQPTHNITILSPSAASNDVLRKTLTPLLMLFSATIHSISPLGAGAVDLSIHLPEASSISSFRKALFSAPGTSDYNLLPFARVPKRLAVFDLDSTLIAGETIDELAAVAGCGDAVAAITRRAMRGEIDFSVSLKERVALLEGLDGAARDAVIKGATFTPGAQRLVKVLKALGCEICIISGGFEFLANVIGERLDADFVYANRLEVDGGRLTGRTVGEVVDGEYKARTLVRLAEERGLAREEVMAVGDGSNDLAMFSEAGLGIAFNAKPIVQEKALARVNQPSLEYVLYLLGLRDETIQKLAGDGA